MRPCLISRWMLRCCVAALVAGAFGMRHVGAEQIRNSPDLVLAFDIAGGQRPRSADGPLLTLSAAGLASVRAPRPGEPRMAVQLSPAEARALLDTVVSRYGAFDIDSDAIHQALSQADRPRLRIADASTTSLTLAIDGRHHAVSVNALPQQAARHPGIAPLQRFLQLSRYLQSKAAALAGQGSATATPRTPD